MGDAVPLNDSTAVVDTVADVQARYVATPESTEQAAAVLRMATERGLKVVPRGTATKLEWGKPPDRVDILLDTSRLVGIVDHAAGDLVVRVRAGTPMSRLAGTLFPKRQRLSLSTRLPVQDGYVGGTVGGTIAANPSSQLRYGFGTIRDLLIGVTVVLADGTIAHAGGGVVKNVAGYDLGKLLVGSLGTLGVVTEAVFRLHPAPSATRLVTVEVDQGEIAGWLAAALRRAQLAPSAVEVDAWNDGAVTVGVLVEGVPNGVVARSEAAARILGRDAEITVVEGPSELPDWWLSPATDAAGTSLRIAVPPSVAGPMVDIVRATSARAGVTVTCRGSLGAGVLHAGLSGEYDVEPVAALVEELRELAAKHEGTVLVESAARDVHRALGKRGTDAFGPIPALPLMERLKHEFDPDRVLAPGRFAGAI
ncbi:MAG: FAD-binding oxidoreductase [Streptosporangiales bacterium]|nr:FAD-binding oxidoreductase [Streptosporangiales bacterium]MBO0891482.1 FAD-binding oxidoreductase [Acidothermales bacterium]